MLQLRNINAGYSKNYNNIHDISFEVGKGKVVAIIGNNGVGKTTLLKTIMGLLYIESGEIIFDGNPIENTPTDDIALKGISYVPQGRQIFPQLSVEENLLLGCTVRKMNLNTARDLGYEFFPALAQISKRKGGMLSGGQQQQLAIARALVVQPKLIMLDEPAEGIQPNIVQEIGGILTRISNDLSIGVLLVEQFVSFALSFAHSYHQMQGGQLTKGIVLTKENRTNAIKNIKL